MKKGITTHVLDLANGKPAQNIKVELYKWEQTADGEQRVFLSAGITNDDGRVETPLLETIETGEYELVYFIEEYLYPKDAERKFLKKIPIRFFADQREVHYHVPLLLSPWGYQTYRGS